MMSESIDETLDKDEAEEETEELTNQVSRRIRLWISIELAIYNFIKHITIPGSIMLFYSYLLTCLSFRYLTKLESVLPPR